MKKARFSIMSDDIHKYYLVLSQVVLGHFDNDLRISNTLKTDAWNEMSGALPEGGIVPKLWGSVKIIEYSDIVINDAKLHFPKLNIIKGDIRDLPFEDEEFNLILDLSTLDHIPQDDLPNTIKGYARVLRKGGEFLLITWFIDPTGNSVNMKTNENDKWSPDKQYLFDYDKTIKELKKYFILLEEDILFADSNRYLDYLLLKKT